MMIPNLLPAGHKPDYMRLLRALRREPPVDRVPFYELFVEDVMVERMIGKPCSPATEIEMYYRLGHDYVNFSPELGLDQTGCLATGDTGANNQGGTREWLNSGDGILATKSQMDAYRWPKPSARDSARFQSYLDNLPDGMGVVLRPTGVFENVRRLMGMTPLSFALYDDETFVAEVFARVGETILASVQYVLNHCDCTRVFAVIMGDDLGTGKGTIVAPEVLRRHVFPWMKRVADLAHALGMPFGLHSCGDNEAIMDDLIRHVGIDAKHSFQDNVMPVQDFKAKYGDRLCVLGGLDMDKLSSLALEAFEPYCREALRACMAGGSYALGTGNSPATYISLENFYAMHRIGLETLY